MELLLSGGMTFFSILFNREVMVEWCFLLSLSWWNVIPPKSPLPPLVPSYMAVLLSAFSHLLVSTPLLFHSFHLGYIISDDLPEPMTSTTGLSLMTTNHIFVFNASKTVSSRACWIHLWEVLWCVQHWTNHLTPLSSPPQILSLVY